MRWVWIVLFFLTGPVAQAAVHDDKIRIASGQRGGNAYFSGGALCRGINARTPGLCLVEQTTGAFDSVFALDLSDASFAIVQRDLYHAMRSELTGLTGLRLSNDLRTVASLYAETLTVVIRADSDIARFADLRGKRVAAGPLRSGPHWTFRTLLKKVGMGVEDMALVLDEEDPDGVGLCGRTLDAVVLMIGHPSVTLSRLGDACPIRILALGQNEIGAMTDADPGYRPMTVPPGLYPFAPVPVPTIGTDAMLVARDDTPDAQVEALLTILFDGDDAVMGHDDILSPHPVVGPGERGSCHPAAERFYRARGYY